MLSGVSFKCRDRRYFPRHLVHVFLKGVRFWLVRPRGLLFGHYGRRVRKLLFGHRGRRVRKLLFWHRGRRVRNLFGHRGRCVRLCRLRIRVISRKHHNRRSIVLC